jgi:hypothetical protein
VPRLDAQHWVVAKGENWASVASATGIVRDDLVIANGQKVGSPTALVVGQVIHLPATFRG